MNLPEFNKLPGAIAIDLDGTLLNSQTQLSERNRLAIEKCLANDIPVIIATARARRTTNRFIGENLSNKCSLIVLSGSLAVGNPPLGGFFKETLNEDILREIIDIARKRDINTHFTIEIEGFKFGLNWQPDKDTL